MLKVLVPAVALLGLFTVVARPAEVPVVVQHDAAPMGWHLHHEGSLAKLAYGVANSDQLAMMLTCAPGDAEAVVYGDVQPVAARATRVANTVARPDPLSAGEAFETRISLNDPALTGLAEHGRMRVESPIGGRGLRADADERRLIADFLGYCGADRV